MEQTRNLMLVINPIDHTPEMIRAIFEVKYRMDCALIDYEDEDVQVCDGGDAVYVLANPILDEEAIYDESGRIERYVPVRNITIIWPHNWLQIVPRGDGLGLDVKTNLKVRILRTDLCIRLRKDAENGIGTGHD